MAGECSPQPDHTGNRGPVQLIIESEFALMRNLTLNGTQQVTVEKVCITDEAASVRWAKWSISVNQSAWTSSAHIQLQTVKNWTIALQYLQLYYFVYHVMFLVWGFSITVPFLSESSPWTCQLKCPMRSPACNVSLIKSRWRSLGFLFYMLVMIFISE